jgi:hypothetical protein
MLKQKVTKIYIDSYDPKKLTPTILEKLDEFFKNTKSYLQLISTSGIFNIENNKIVKLVSNDAPILDVLFENKIKLVLDNSFFEEELVLSQIPIDHYKINITTFHYCYGDKSKLNLVIEGHYESKIDSNYLQKQETNLKGLKKYTHFVPDNFYFLANEEINNYLIKKELNGFLLMLN